MVIIVEERNKRNNIVRYSIAHIKKSQIIVIGIPYRPNSRLSYPTRYVYISKKNQTRSKSLPLPLNNIQTSRDTQKTTPSYPIRLYRDGNNTLIPQPKPLIQLSRPKKHPRSTRNHTSPHPPNPLAPLPTLPKLTPSPFTFPPRSQ